MKAAPPPTVTGYLRTSFFISITGDLTPPVQPKTTRAAVAITQVDGKAPQEQAQVTSWDWFPGSPCQMWLPGRGC